MGESGANTSDDFVTKDQIDRIDQTPYSPIACSDYDYIEIACMDQYTVDVNTDHGTIHGVAADTKVDTSGEFLMVQGADNAQQRVRIDHIRKITVLSKPRRFDEWVFQNPS